MSRENVRKLNNLVESEPDKVLDFVEGRSSSTANFTDLDWWFLAQGASTNCGFYKGRDDNLALKWGRASVAAYEKCARLLSVDPTRQDEAHTREVGAMWLRSWAIQRFGPNAQDPMLNPRIIEQWFLDRVPNRIAAGEPMPDIDAILAREEEDALMQFLQRIRVLTPLVQKGIIQPDSEVGVLVLRYPVAK